MHLHGIILCGLLPKASSVFPEDVRALFMSATMAIRCPSEWTPITQSERSSPGRAYSLTSLSVYQRPIARNNQQLSNG